MKVFKRTEKSKEYNDLSRKDAKLIKYQRKTMVLVMW
jgi:hypothetical protein